MKTRTIGCIAASLGLVWACSYSTSRPARVPPAPRPMPPPVAPIALPAPAPAPPSPAAPVPSGWVNVNGIIVPAIPGLTTALPSATTATAAVPSGWVNMGGIPVPPIPGLTVPAAGAPAAASQPAPAAAALRGGCGHIQIGARRIPLDCMTAGYGKIPWASSLALRRRTFNLRDGYAGAAALPQAVDHRADNSEGPVRDQGEVGACTAFSFAAAVDHAYARASGTGGAVSVMHAWSRYHQPHMEDAASRNLNKGLTFEATWRYDEKTACAWMCDDDCRDLLKVASCADPDPARVRQADAAAGMNVTGVTEIEVDDFKEALAKGQDVWFAMHTDGTTLSKVRGSPAVVPNGDFRLAGSGHAMVLAGYNTQSDGTYFLIHNSWGTDWADRGYAWIREDTLRRNVTNAYLVEVAKPGQAGPTPSTPTAPTVPVGPAPTAPTIPTVPPQQPTGACGQGQQPDTVLGMCLPVCPDGSPRTFNMCPPPSGSAPGCPQGYTNVFGICVMAAPALAGSDATTGIRYSCGAGGCNYLYPRGQGNCPFATCSKSCPVPKFHLTFGALGVGCSD